ncbi:MAG: YihY/virulence factor BrkB family protein [Bacteroidales bacterium]|nr:YihY/virulence factor BrkB family protein [Bacteroidales bacterium]
MQTPSIKNYYRKTDKFLSHDIWDIDHKDYRGSKARGLRYLKILLITLKGMSTHKVGLQAAALTLFSLIAIVPFIAVAYAITRGFGFAGELESMIYTQFSGQEEIMQWILTSAHNLLDTSKSGFFGILGFLTFLWSIVWLMISVEQMFNNIWQVKNNSPLIRKILVYFGLIILFPLILGSSFMIPLSYNHFIQRIGWNVAFLSSLKPVVGWLIHVVFTGFLFFTAFTLIPKTKVYGLPALKAALFTALAFVVIQILYVETQLFLSKLNAVYGVFAALPFFMMWLNTTWFIVLLGAELSFTFQYIDHRYATKNPV